MGFAALAPTYELVGALCKHADQRYVVISIPADILGYLTRLLTNVLSAHFQATNLPYNFLTSNVEQLP